MKKILVIYLFCCFFISFTFSQDAVHEGGGQFSKKIEYNILSNILPQKVYNLSSKGIHEKLFFGDCNSPVEFFIESFFEGEFGFRIKTDSLKKSIILEIKYIANYREARNEAFRKYPLQIVTWNQSPHLSIEIYNQILSENQEQMNRAYKEMENLYKIDSCSYFISHQFAYKLYNKIVEMIRNFQAKGIPPIIEDGYSVTFRCVVGDEVWTLTIHAPTGQALRMSNICRQIIKDAIDKDFYELNYLTDDLELFEDNWNNKH